MINWSSSRTWTCWCWLTTKILLSFSFSSLLLTFSLSRRDLSTASSLFIPCRRRHRFPRRRLWSDIKRQERGRQTSSCWLVWNTHILHTPLTFRPVTRSGQIAELSIVLPFSLSLSFSLSLILLMPLCVCVYVCACSSLSLFLLDRLTVDDAQSGTFQENGKREEENTTHTKKGASQENPARAEKGINEPQKLRDTRSIIARCRMQPGAKRPGSEVVDLMSC